MRSCPRAVRLCLLLTLALAEGALAQGVTGSAVRGTVTSEDGRPVRDAKVKLTNTATGETFSATSGKNGDYFIDNVPPADTYSLSASAANYESVGQPDISLTLGQRMSANIVMRAAASEEVIVIAHADANADRSRTGAATTVKQQTINELPLQGRNFTDLTLTDPRVSSGAGGGVSFAGQNGRYNNIQIDGGANNDLFGLAGSGTPGGQSNAKPLSLEAIKEFNIQIAPFDVRLGDFAGGLVNAVTKSGTNEFHGSLFTYFQSKSLAGYQSDPTFTDYHTLQYGATFSGPIIEDKLHFFIATDLQSKSSAFSSPINITGNDAYDLGHAGFTNSTVQQFQTILNKYGINSAGDASAPPLGNPDHNLFIKLTSSAFEDTHIELSYNLVSASSDVLIRNSTDPSLSNLRDGYELSNSGYSQANTTNTARLKITSSFDGGALSNEFIGSYSSIRDIRALPNPNTPLILVDVGHVGSADAWLSAGSERFSQANSLAQDIWQVQDNLTWAIEDHRITFGTSNEFFHFNNVFLQASTGVWAFDSLADFDAGKAEAFQRRFGITTAQQAGAADFDVAQLGFYVQDEWTPFDRLSVTPGVRIDVPFLSSAVTNPAVLASQTLPIDTSKVPSGNALWSPRLGFNWDVQGNSDTVVRGGTGVFTGRPPYVFVSNAYAGNGLSQIQLSCTAANGIPTFTANGAAQPTSCAGGTGKPVPPQNQGEIDYFDPNTRYPQNLRVAIGADRRLPFGIVASADFLYTRDLEGFYTTDSNLEELGTDGDGRPIYGTFTPVGGTTFKPTPTRRDPTNLTQAVEVYNKSGGYVTSTTFQLQKQFGRRYSVSAAYSYTRSYDLISLTSSQAFSNFQFAPVDGSLADRNVRPSAFDRPNKITVTGTAAIAYGFSTGISYMGQSGTPYTWSVNGDINADGVNGNDLPFIPANASQISLKDPTQYAALAAFINGQSCLRDARGSLLQRGACRNPWQDFLDARFSWTSPESWKGTKAELQWDIFNVLNLINSNWGHILSVSQFETAPSAFLKAVGYDYTNKRPIYSFSPPSSIVSTIYGPTASRWRMQFGGRVMF